MKKKFIITALLILAAGVGGYGLHQYLYVEAITDVQILNMPEDGYTLTRYTQEARTPIAAKAGTRNKLADTALRYESSDPVVAEVTDEGVLIGHTPGTTAVRVTAVGNPKVYTEVPVTVVQKAVRMEVSRRSFRPMSTIIWYIGGTAYPFSQSPHRPTRRWKMSPMKAVVRMWPT